MTNIGITCLFILLGVVNCQGTVYSDDAASFTSTSTRYDSTDIQVNDKRKIVLSIDSMRLSSEGYLKIVDEGNAEEIPKFKMYGRTPYRMSRNGRLKREKFPLIIQSQSNQLSILLRGRGSYDAHYSSYVEDGTCAKSDIHEKFGDVDSYSCDIDDELVTVASRCDVTLRCSDENLYQQTSKLVSCVNGYWEGNIQCQPRLEVINEQCPVDFDQMTNGDSCPYTPDEILNYYITVEEVDISEPGLGRGSRSRINCNPFCGRNRAGVRASANCGAKYGIKRFVRCYLCRIRHKCRSTTAGF